MNLPQWILVCLCLFVADAGAQISGTFKISKVAPDTGMEQMTFNADKSVDVVYGWVNPTVAGGNRSTKEARGSYTAMNIDAMIAKMAATPGFKEDKTYKSYERMIQFKAQGYELCVYVTFKDSGGYEHTSFFVRKGSELVDFTVGSIFRKSFWSF